MRKERVKGNNRSKDDSRNLVQKGKGKGKVRPAARALDWGEAQDYQDYEDNPDDDQDQDQDHQEDSEVNESYEDGWFNNEEDEQEQLEDQ